MMLQNPWCSAIYAVVIFLAGFARWVPSRTQRLLDWLVITNHTIYRSGSLHIETITNNTAESKYRNNRNSLNNNLVKKVFSTRERGLFP